MGSQKTYYAIRNDFKNDLFHDVLWNNYSYQYFIHLSYKEFCVV
jgi:hypothetical protein